VFFRRRKGNGFLGKKEWMNKFEELIIIPKIVIKRNTAKYLYLAVF
jgi:hypothetical protein